MKFFKFLFWLPVLLVVIVFVSSNNEKMSFSVWPFLPSETKIDISGALAIIGLILFGYIVAKVDSWFSYAPVRKALSAQKKQNKVLGKKQKELTETISGLQENISSLKSQNIAAAADKISVWSGLKSKFSRK